MGDRYTMQEAGKSNQEEDVIVATHPAHPGTFLVYAFEDGSTNKVPVILWGVLEDGTPVPITMTGVWDGTSNRNRFVLHPSGECGDYENEWDNLEAAIEEVRKRA